MSDEIPRRCRLDLSTPAELSIRAAIHAVEDAGADVRLTDAVVLLGEALNAVADYVDGVPKAARSLPDEPASEGWQSEWPTEPGWYWFYGWTHKCAEGQPRMELAQVRRISNGILHICHSEVIHKSEGAAGQWLAMDLPLPPASLQEGQ